MVASNYSRKGVLLNALSLSSLIPIHGIVFTSNILGAAPGSTVTAASSDGTVITVTAGVFQGLFALSGAPTVTLVETLAGGYNSPKTTVLVLTVS